MLTTIVKKKDFGLYSHMTVKAPAIAKQAKPGQFVEVKITGENAPFWRRPFCICRADKDCIELLIKEVGRGSALMRQKNTGDVLDIIGPLGNSFSIKGKQHALLVGGGFGVAPLLFLAEQLKAKGISADVMIGGRCEEDLLLRKEMKMTGAAVSCSTDDGSFGTKGLVTKILEKKLAALDNKAVIYCAGPWPMMKAVSKIAGRHDLPCQASLEEVMACGLGVCNGCVVKIAGTFKRVCNDGPVFNSHEVLWEK